MALTVQDSLTADRLKSLSPMLRKAARFVVDHPGEVATRSQRHIARTAQISAPTFTRLAHAIGYNSYDDLRDQCRAELLQNRTILAERAEVLVANPTDQPGKTAFFNEHALSSVQNLHKLMQQTDHASLAEAVSTLAEARRVVLVGVMSARPILEYVTYIANMSLEGWILAGRDGDGSGGFLNDLGPQDAAIVFSIAPYADKTVTMAKLLSERNLPVMAVTDNHLSPLVDYADHSFFLNTSSPQFFPSHTAAMVFFEAVIGMVIRRKGIESQKRIAAVEQQNHEFGEYWQDKPAR